MRGRQHKFIIWLMAGVSTGPLLALLPSQGSSMLVNGDFESPAIEVNLIGGQLPSGWSGNPQASFDVAPAGWNMGGASWPAAESGGQYADLGNHPLQILFQTFAISSAGNYDLTFLNQPTQLSALPGNIPLLDPSPMTETTSTLGLMAIALWGLGVWRRKSDTAKR
jgi:hypothetical protein